MKWTLVDASKLEHDRTYFIECYGPHGIYATMNGIYKNDVRPYLRFDNVMYTQSLHDNNMQTKKFGVIHKPYSESNSDTNYYWKYYRNC